MKKTIQSTATLNNGVEIPYLGLGTWQARGQNCVQAVSFALTNGYSLIDTAQAYGNEAQVGKGWKASGKSRSEIFLTTKIRNMNQGYQSSKRSLEKSLKHLQTDYVDLCLIHWPNLRDFNKSVRTWQALVEMREIGKCRAIGVSNFTIPLIEKLINEIDILPAINQVEFHPFLYQKELLAYCQEKGIQIEAYSPLARAKFLDNDQLQEIAKKHHQTAAQVMLAWGIHHNIVVIPKSTQEERILENSDIFFELDKADLEILDNLSPQRRLINPANGPFSR